MNSKDLIRMAFKNLFRRKLRTILTTLGVVIGSAAIITMLSLGIGMQENYIKEIGKMGSLNIINIDNFGVMFDDQGFSSNKNIKLDDKVIMQIENWEGVEAVTPLMEASVKCISGKYVSYLNLIGIRPETMETFGFEVEEGRLLTSQDKLDIVFGKYVGNNFYNPKSRMDYMYSGQSSPVDLMNDKFTISFDMNYGEKIPDGEQNKKPPKVYKIHTAGLLKESMSEKDYGSYMNIDSLKSLVAENSRANGGKVQTMPGSTQQGYTRAMIKVKEIKNVRKIQDKIKEMGFSAFSIADILESVEKTTNSLQAILGGIAAVSMLVAAIGIGNTMVMSIYERTREIGVMKVLGASFSDIRRLFLLEAGIIGLFGGITGFIFSLGVSYILNTVGLSFMNFMGPVTEGSKISVIPLWLALYTIFFTTIVGVLSGFYPARRAMKLSAIEAIRIE